MNLTGHIQEDNVGPRIAIVDDDDAIREALKSLMRSVRFQVDAFGSAEEFLASDCCENTECLILDVYLPGMTGFELQEHLNLNRDPERRTIPIIFISAHADDFTRRRAIEAGAVEFLAKPVRRDTLFQTIEAAISR